MITIKLQNAVSPERVILVDPSLSDFVGHHAQYDISILESCKNKGIPSCVLAHRLVNVSINESIPVEPVFSEDMWGTGRVYRLGWLEIKQFVYGCISTVLLPALAKNNLARLRRWLSGYIHKKYTENPTRSRSNIARIILNSKIFLAHQKHRCAEWIGNLKAKAKSCAGNDSNIVVFFIYTVLYIIPYGVYSIVTNGHRIFNAGMSRRQATPSKHAFVRGVHFAAIYLPKRLVSLLIKVLGFIVPALVVQIIIGVIEQLRLRNFVGSLPPKILAIRFENPRYYFEAKGGLKSIAINRGDLVFFHMVIGRNALETAALCEYIFSRTGVPPVVLMRYPPSFFMGTYEHSSRIAIRKFEYLFDMGKIRLASDSERLIYEYGKVTYVPFELFPIPHGQTATTHGSSVVRMKPCIRIASLGNARGEKGFIEIYYMMRELAERELGVPIEFVIQANNPDADAAPFVKELEAERFPFPVSIITESLDKTAYEALVSSVDIILAPYWREIYASRTSGVALEAIVGGKILITTIGTWMSDQARLWGNGVTVENRSVSSLTNAVIEAISNKDQLALGAMEASRAAGMFHSGMSTIEHLLKDKVSFENRNKEVCFIYPWDNLFQYNSGASVRSSLMVKKILDAGWKVNVMGDILRAKCFPIGITEVALSEPLASFSNPLYLVDYMWRLLCSPRMIGSEDFQYRFRYWMRARSSRLIINSVLRRCSAAVIEYPFLASVISPFCKAYEISMVVNDHDVLGMQSGRKKVRQWMLDREVEALNISDFATAISEEDRQTFAKLGAHTHLIDNSIDINTYTLSDIDEARNDIGEYGIKLPMGKFGLFVGSAHPPNYAAVKRIIELSKDVRLITRNIHFVIVGSCSQPEKESHGSNCFHLGTVPRSILRALYSLASFVVIPLEYGTGSSVKTLEAFAYGKVIIGTDTAFRGFNVTNLNECIISNDFDYYPELIIKLLDDDRAIQEMEKKAINFSKTRDYHVTYQPIIDAIELGKDSNGSERKEMLKNHLDSGPITYDLLRRNIN